MNLQYSRHLATDSSGIVFIVAGGVLGALTVVFAIWSFCHTPDLAPKEDRDLVPKEDRGLDVDLDEEKDLPVPEVAKTISNGSEDVSDPYLTSCDVHKCASVSCGACNAKGKEITFLALESEETLDLANDVDERVKRKNEMATDQVFEL